MPPAPLPRHDILDVRQATGSATRSDFYILTIWTGVRIQFIDFIEKGVKSAFGLLAQFRGQYTAIDK